MKNHSLSYDVHNNIVKMDFSNKIEVIKQYIQSVMNIGIVSFFKSVIQTLQRLKIMTMAKIYGKYPESCYGSWIIFNTIVI